MKIKCTKCGEEKTRDNFWFDERRKSYQTPCKDCRNQQKRMRRREQKINGRFTKSELEKDYRLKDLPKDLIELISTKIILDRELSKKDKVKLTGNDNLIVIFCPVCGGVEILKTPICLDDLIEIGTLFEKQHERCRKE